jgi:hypothetical protein
MYVRCPLSLRNVEDLLAESGIGHCHGAAAHDRVESMLIIAWITQLQPAR